MGPAALAIASAGLNIIGSISSAKGLRQQGKDAQVAADFKSAQLDQKAGQERASAQREALERQRKTTLALSRAQALAASSGAGATDETVLNLASNIAGEGQLAFDTSLYNGEESAIGLETNADATRYEGYLTRKGLNVQANNTLFSGLANAGMAGVSIYERFKGDGSPTVPSEPIVPQYSSLPKFDPLR